MIRLMRYLIPSKRNCILLVPHLLIFVSAYLLALMLRFDFDVPPPEWQAWSMAMPLFLTVKIVVFYLFGAFSGWWRYLTFADLADLLKAATVSAVIIGAIDYMLPSQFESSRGVLILDYFGTVLLLGGLRASSRLFEEQFISKAGQNAKRAIVVGANRTGEMLVRQNNGRSGYRIVGFLDDNPSCHGSRLGGVPVLGPCCRAVELAQVARADAILLAGNHLPGVQVRALIQECRAAGVAIKIVPSVEDIINGRYKFQPRDISIDDLLRRAPVELDNEAIAATLKGRRVMVTGAGGSIGSEICRQIMKYAPESLILVERFESGLFFIHRELSILGTTTECIPCIADVLDRKRMSALFKKFRPEIVFHAAAHKHVPMMEENPGESVKNNVFGTKVVADMSHRFGVERFVLISTDKAVNPTSVMGATKQLAERYICGIQSTSTTKFMTVRFGNVLGSIGSVVPLFQEQIRRGGPLTVTHPEMRRFFMTIPEASQLVLQSAAMGKGGEIFVLDMGEPVRIVDLAKDMILLSGFTLDDIRIEFVGVRAGEKLYEELHIEEEQLLTTAHPKLRAVYHRPYDSSDRRWIAELRSLLNANEDVLHKIRELVPEFRAEKTTVLPVAFNPLNDTFTSEEPDLSPAKG